MGVESVAVKFQRDAGGGRLLTVIDDACKRAQSSVADAGGQAGDGQVAGVDAAHADVANWQTEARWDLRAVEAPVANDDELGIGLALGYGGSHRQRGWQVGGL